MTRTTSTLQVFAITVFASLLFFTGTLVHAQQTAVAGVDVFGSAQDRGLCAGDPLSSLFCRQQQDIPGLINTVFQLAISAGAILALLRIVYSGYLYMGSADMWSSKSHAKEVFRDAVVGLLILLSIWLVLFQINPCILNLGVLQNGKASGSCATPSGSTSSQTSQTPAQASQPLFPGN